MLSSLGWWAVVIAGVVASATPLALRPLLRRLGAIDNPNHRSSHSQPTVRGAGAAQLLGLLVGGFVGAASLSTSRSVAITIAVLTAGVLVGLVGLVEDLRGLTVKVRLGAQLLVGAAFVLVLGTLTEAPWLLVAASAVGFAAYVNFSNFMDGINGISSLHGAVAGLAYSLIGLVSDTDWMALVGLLTAVVFLVFLPWNLMPPGMFLGDVGSYLLGGMLGGVGIGGLAVGLPAVAALAPLSVYSADTVFTLVKRVARREPLYEAHRTHVYQQLTKGGMSHIAGAALVAGFTACASVLGLLSVAGAASIWGVTTALILLLALYLMLPALVSKTTRSRTWRVDVAS